MDVGFRSAGVKIVWANEIDKDACSTYEENHPESHLSRGDIRDMYADLEKYKNIDIVFGGPPCQGFSVAGKMDPEDERSTLLWSFLDVVKIVRPRVFVCENVKALATLEKWEKVREKFLLLAEQMGYRCYPFLLNSAQFGIPQKRERVFFIGFLEKDFTQKAMLEKIKKYEKPLKSVRDAIFHLGPAGTTHNPLTCTAKITLAVNPVMRRSPYAGMLFNGIGRPLDLDNVCSTLPASMGGNKTPIIDETLLHGGATDDWVVNYHKGLLEKKIEPQFTAAPSCLRRITLKEAAQIQTFPENYVFSGSKSSIYRQIGNAVPCLLAEIVAKAIIEELDDISVSNRIEDQLLLAL